MSTFLASGLAAVFALAAIGKLSSKPALGEGILAIAELLVGCLLIETPFRIEAMLASIVLTGSYLGHSLYVSQSRCHCFGQSLPSTDLRAQRVRNAVLFLSALVATLAAVSGGAPSSVPIFDYAGGAATGIFIVVLPWILDSVEGSRRSQLDRHA